MLHCPRSFMRTVAYSGIFLTISIASALAADPTGDWRVADGVADIRIGECNGDMWGVVVWEKMPGGRDTHNPDVSKQSRPTLGMPILLDMKKKPGTDQWEGQVYNAKDGQTYSSSITPVDADHLEIKGCVLGFLCGGETWTRVGPPIPSSPANSMAKGAAKPAPAAAKPAPAAAKPAAPAPGSPKSTSGAATASAKGRTQPTDPVGDICLLPDIARFTH